MQKVIIAHKEVLLAPRYMQGRKLNQKYGLESGYTLMGESYDRFCIDAIWCAIKRGFIFKPFITKRRMVRMLAPWDMDRFRSMFEWVYTGKMFTEEELNARVAETRRRIEEETKKAVESAAKDFAENSLETASDNLKKK